MRRTATAALVALLLTGCAAPATPGATVFAFGRPEDAIGLPAPGAPVEGRPGSNGGTILEPVSAEITHDVPRRFSLGHCGIQSPVDVDESFWDATAGVDAAGQPIDLESHPETINATLGVIIVTGDRAFFRTDAGTIVTFERHAGEREFPACD